MASAPSLDPIALRRERIASAIRYLKRRCILVDVVDRSAQVRRYRVSGVKENLFAEDVIALAERHGLEAQHG